MDFSPVHPDVWASTDAERWTFYLQLRNAYEEGVREVRDKFDARQGQNVRSAKGMNELIKQHAAGATF